MEKKTWQRNADGYYYIKMVIEGVEKEMIWDPGTVDPTCNSGIIIDCDNYNRIKDKLQEERSVNINRVGHESTGRCGKGKAKIKDFGPEVETYIVTVCGGNKGKLIGSCFFNTWTDYETRIDHKTKELTIVNKKEEEEEKKAEEKERQQELERLRKELEEEKKKNKGGIW